MTRNTDSFKKLYKTADEQRGFFTARQAVDSGYSEKNHAYYVNSGAWVREERAIYRIAQYPEPDDGDLILWTLWSRDRKGRPQGVFSHQTALSIHELTDLNPSKLHMTVPPEFRRSAPTPKILVLHPGIIEPKDIERRKGYRVTNVRRTLEDLMTEKSATEGILRQGVVEGIRRGILSVREVTDSPVLRKMTSLARKTAGGRGRP